MALLVRWCQRHRWLVVTVWVTSLVGALAMAGHAGPRFSVELAGHDAESQQALDTAASFMPSGTVPDLETVVVRARSGTVQVPAVRARIAEMVAQLGTVPGVAGAFDPFSPAAALPIGGSPLSADGQAAIVSVLMKGSPTAPDHTAVRALIDTARAYDGPDLQVEVNGPGATIIVQSGISLWPVALAVGIALLVLGLMVRAPAAVAVCMLVALVAAGMATAAAMLLSLRADLNQLAPLLTLVLAFGMTLGSSVVIVNRTQNQLRAGLDPPQAARAALRHPGRATAIGGLALAGVMLATSALRLSVFDGLALAGFTAAMASVLAVMTLLPAALRLTGHGLLVWTERTLLRRSGTGLPVRPGLRSWWAGMVARHPQVLAGVAIVALAVLAMPVTGLTLGGGDNGADPTSNTTRRGYDLISEAYFPGLNGPMLAVVTGLHTGAPDPLPGVIQALNDAPGVTRAFLSLRNDAAGGALVQILPDDGPRAPGATELVHRLRDQVVPAAIAGKGLTVRISGQAALFADMSSRFAAVLPGFLALEFGMLGLTTLFALRSVRHSLAVMTASLLALAATLGAITWVFTEGHLAARLGVRPGPVEPFLLGIIMIVVFGLAIGMHLTMLSSLHAAADDPDQRRAISSRHADVGHIVVTTSLIMVIVFAALAAQPVRVMKLLGVGLSVGVVLDALVVRILLLPALLHLLRPGRGTDESSGSGHGGHGLRVFRSGTSDTGPVGGRVGAGRAAGGGRSGGGRDGGNSGRHRVAAAERLNTHTGPTGPFGSGGPGGPGGRGIVTADGPSPRAGSRRSRPAADPGSAASTGPWTVPPPSATGRFRSSPTTTMPAMRQSGGPGHARPSTTTSAATTGELRRSSRHGRRSR
ncbi:MMPL family transporter [Frankia sp. AgPm24]|uniref:MMPL family transporter n=1 Tax=Frankia sp. AgPm24 TaxID=631128 RepID=UPI00200FB68F|nr:MMPL family transporter [Frankia sp. AgPm24]MCK9923477.1 MMPL family transporter [Frankia sp. AgPm24]